MLAESPKVRVKISEMMEAHWERWVDERLPILGDRTQMEAVKDADGREIVESLIKPDFNSDARTDTEHFLVNH